MPNETIYLDHNATTRIDPAALEEMMPFLTDAYGNPSSGYTFGVKVREAIELARERVAALVGGQPGEIVFTSGGTESDNSALHSALALDPQRQHIVTTAVEHSAILRPCAALAQRGSAVTHIGVDRDGNLDLDELENAIRPETALVSAMWANNETGVIFPIEKIAEIARRKGVLFHTDAVQAAGKVPIRLSESEINYASFSAHKLHGPKGVGALYLNRRSAFRPLLFGGGQENGRRGGTENVASIIGFGKAAEIAQAQLAEEPDRVRGLRDLFETGLRAGVPDVSVNGGRAPRLTNTSSLSFAGIEAEGALILLDQRRVCCSAGSACKTGSPEASHVLRAMQLTDGTTRNSLRFSFGRENTEAEVARTLEIVPAVIARLRALSA
ncbi:MAG: aminotransferase class V-fold PLP-dependent enzyme [Verrucomicrobiota bacterium]|nr:aminotransferase class V-fold PLP-dependent enzyme [Verrucomicrobiota bacterium]